MKKKAMLLLAAILFITITYSIISFGAEPLPFRITNATYSKQLNDKVTIRTGVNMDLLFIAASTGGGFGSQPAYLTSQDKYGINRSIKTHYARFVSNQNAKAIYQNAMAMENPPKKFVGPILTGILALDEARYEYLIDSQLPIWKSFEGFAKDTNALKFFEANDALYKRTFEDFTGNVLKFNHVERMEEFFGYSMKDDRFVVVISTVMSGGQAMDVRNKDGSVIHYSIVNPGDPELDVLYTLYHETSHNFYDARIHNLELVNKNLQYANVLGRHERDFGSELNEVITRAISCVIMEKYHGKQAEEAYLAQMSANDWKGVREIYGLIKREYLPNRYKYKTFLDFTPRIFELVKNMKI